MLSTSEKLTFVGTLAESVLCLCYLLLIGVIATTRSPALKTPFYKIFVVTGIAALLNDVALFIMRIFNQVFYLGPEYGPTCISMMYLSHIFVSAHSILKALQVINRFTAVFLPFKHEKLWSSNELWIIIVSSFIIPACIFSFMVINQTALYIDIGGGKMKYAGIEKVSTLIAKILITTIFGLFIAVTLPMNILLIVKLRKLKKEDSTVFQKEKMYLGYVLAITAAHIISGAHQMLWLIATVTDNRELNAAAMNLYSYPNAILTFTSPIALLLMSKPVWDEIRYFVTRQRVQTRSNLAELFMCLLYIVLILVIATTRNAALKTPFYRIFAVTGVAAVLNLIVVNTLRMFNQVFFLGPEFGQTCNFLVYFSHVFVFAHSVLKAMQIINRFTALHLPFKHNQMWASNALWFALAATFILPAGILSFMVINQKALYIDIGGGIMKYASTDKLSQLLAKTIITSVFVLFITVTLPMNVLLIIKMRRLRKEDNTAFLREKMYLSYVLVITAAHMIGAAHQILWLTATVMQSSFLNSVAQYSYAYPNTIITFTSPIALVLMSQQVRHELLFFVTRQHIGVAVGESTVSVRVASST